MTTEAETGHRTVVGVSVRTIFWLCTIPYAVVATFLCLAAIQNPHLTNEAQWVWCAVAVCWGPVVAIVVAFFVGMWIPEPER